MNGNEIQKISISQFVANGENEPVQDSDFFITDNIYPYIRDYPGRLDFYAIALCTGGTYRCNINLQEHTITKNTFAVFKPHQTVHMLEIKNYKGVLIVFNRDFFLQNSAIANSHFLDTFGFFDDAALPIIGFKKHDVQMLLEYFTLLHTKTQLTDNPYRRQITRSILIALLYEINAVYSNRFLTFKKNLSRKEELALQFQDMLMKHFKEQRSVHFYADALSITPKYLSELLKDVLGRNASDLIDDAVVLEAKVLLKNVQYTVAQVADSLNFSDAAAFTKFFKKHATISPSDYRKL